MRKVFRVAIVTCLSLSLLCSIFSVYAETAADVGVDESTAQSTNTDVETTGKQMVNVVRVKNPVKYGGKILASNVEVVEMNKDYAPANAFSDPDAVIGWWATTEITAGDYLYQGKITKNKPTVAATDDAVLKKQVEKSFKSVVRVTEFIYPDTGIDVTTTLQKIIDMNPNKTIYFPDGEYVISQSLLTNSNPIRSVSLRFSDGAVLRASKSWKNTSGEALIVLGAKGTTNNNKDVGSYYGVMGGTFECEGLTNGIATDWGRESIIRNVCIKNPKIGISIGPGCNGQSSDMDVEDVTIIGNGTKNTIGIKAVGLDNTFSNVTIYDMQIGLETKGANSVKNIKCILTEKGKSLMTDTKSIGINDEISDNLFGCTVVNYPTAYVLNGNERAIFFIQCVARWTEELDQQVAFDIKGSAGSLALSQPRVEFCGSKAGNRVIKASGGAFKLDGPIFNEAQAIDKTYKNYLATNVVPLS